MAYQMLASHNDSVIITCIISIILSQHFVINYSICTVLT